MLVPFRHFNPIVSNIRVELIINLSGSKSTSEKIYRKNNGFILYRIGKYISPSYVHTVNDIRSQPCNLEYSVCDFSHSSQNELYSVFNLKGLYRV